MSKGYLCIFSIEFGMGVIGGDLSQHDQTFASLLLFRVRLIFVHRLICLIHQLKCPISRFDCQKKKGLNCPFFLYYEYFFLSRLKLILSGLPVGGIGVHSGKTVGKFTPFLNAEPSGLT